MGIPMFIRSEKIEQNKENKAEYRTLGAARADGRSSGETPEMLFVVFFYTVAMVFGDFFFGVFWSM